MIYRYIVILESSILHAKFWLEIGLPVLEKKIFKFLSIYGRGGHFGHVTWIIYIYIGSPFP